MTRTSPRKKSTERALLLTVLVVGLLGAGGGAAHAQRAIFLVRHAEKVDESQDAALSAAGRARAARLARMLRDADIKGVYVSEFQRTRDTAAPLCKALELKPQVVPAGDHEALLRRARAEHPDDAVLVVGHSNTLPDLLQKLGVPSPPAIPSAEYDNVLLVIPRRFLPPQLVRLRMP